MADIADYFKHARATKLAKSALGQKLWNFLNEDKIKGRMEAASDLGQAAVKGIADQLVEEFEDDLWNDQVKQLIGDMARVVLTEEGFSIDQKNVDVREFPFVKGTRYIREGWFPRIHIFRSSNDPRDLCLTNTQKGEKLPSPPKGAKHWVYWTSFGSTLRGAVITGGDPRKMRDEIDNQGYSLQRQERILRRG